MKLRLRTIMVAGYVCLLATCVWAGLTVQEIELLDLGYAPPYSGVYDPVLVAARAAVKAL